MTDPIVYGRDCGDGEPTISEEADHGGECATCGGQAPRLYSWEEELICEPCYEDLIEPDFFTEPSEWRLR